MVLRWLHISDIHIKSPVRYDSDVVLGSFLESIPQLAERYGKIDAIIITGDIAFSGQRSEYDIATVFMDKLLEVTGCSKDQLVVVPGNHDVDRSAGVGLARTLSGREEADDYFDPIKPLIHVEKRLKNFIEWHDTYFAGRRIYDQNSTCQKSVRISVGDTEMLIVPINTATFSVGDDDHGNLWIGRRCIA